MQRQTIGLTGRPILRWCLHCPECWKCWCPCPWCWLNHIPLHTDHPTTTTTSSSPMHQLEMLPEATGTLFQTPSDSFHNWSHRRLSSYNSPKHASFYATNHVEAGAVCSNVYVFVKVGFQKNRICPRYNHCYLQLTVLKRQVLRKKNVSLRPLPVTADDSDLDGAIALFQ